MPVKTEILKVRISKEQKQTLDKLKEYNVNVCQFVRNAIKEKLEREKVEIITNYKESLDECPFKKQKICKLGTGKAKGYSGCGKLAYLEWGICYDCKKNFLLNTDEGQELIIKASKKAKMYSAQESKKTYNKEKKERKWELMSTVQRINKAKQVFQKWVRQRDKEESCISCGTVSSDLWDGGHYLKAEIYTGVIFNEMNVHKQCRKCNRFLGGNEAQYRIALCLKYGESKVVELESWANQTRQYRWSSEELKKIIDIYK